MIKVFGQRNYIIIINLFMRIVLKKKKFYYENPEAIIKKIKNVPGKVYWFTLGKLKFKDY